MTSLAKLFLLSLFYSLLQGLPCLRLVNLNSGVLLNEH